MGKKGKNPPGDPWRAARARVWYLDGLWHYTVVNWHGKVVAHDMAGGARGRQAIFTAAARMVEAVRLMDGTGQGKHLKHRHVGYLPVFGPIGQVGAARSTWPNLPQWHRKAWHNKQPRQRIILRDQPRKRDNGIYLVG